MYYLNPHPEPPTPRGNDHSKSFTCLNSICMYMQLRKGVRGVYNEGSHFPYLYHHPPSPNFCQNNLEIKMFGIYSNRAAVYTQSDYRFCLLLKSVRPTYSEERKKKPFTLLLVLDLLYGRYYAVVTGDVFWGGFGWRCVHIYIQMMLSNISVS